MTDATIKCLRDQLAEHTAVVEEKNALTMKLAEKEKDAIRILTELEAERKWTDGYKADIKILYEENQKLQAQIVRLEMDLDLEETTPELGTSVGIKAMEIKGSAGKETRKMLDRKDFELLKETGKMRCRVRKHFLKMAHVNRAVRFVLFLSLIQWFQAFTGLFENWAPAIAKGRGAPPRLVSVTLLALLMPLSAIRLFAWLLQPAGSGVVRRTLGGVPHHMADTALVTAWCWWSILAVWVVVRPQLWSEAGFRLRKVRSDEEWRHLTLLFKYTLFFWMAVHFIRGCVAHGFAAAQTDLITISFLYPMLLCFVWTATFVGVSMFGLVNSSLGMVGFLTAPPIACLAFACLLCAWVDRDHALLISLTWLHLLRNFLRVFGYCARLLQIWALPSGTAPAREVEVKFAVNPAPRTPFWPSPLSAPDDPPPAPPAPGGMLALGVSLTSLALALAEPALFDAEPFGRGALRGEDPFAEETPVREERWLKDISTSEKNHFKKLLQPLQTPIVQEYQVLTILDSYVNYTMQKIANATGSEIVWNRTSSRRLEEPASEASSGTSAEEELTRSYGRRRRSTSQDLPPRARYVNKILIYMNKEMEAVWNYNTIVDRKRWGVGNVITSSPYGPHGEHPERWRRNGTFPFPRQAPNNTILLQEKVVPLEFTLKAEDRKYDNKYAQQLQADYMSLVDNINDAIQKISDLRDRLWKMDAFADQFVALPSGVWNKIDAH
ncbi:unnamed protein product [Effrenium voratum]|uniref:Uncharacterized protein n=1 Tax=Effrenium voratum TaxID=2562239 RepID=A0AA36IEC6_9DINO|nr:unnamed protein product [Effrenium voratum]